LSLLFAAGDAFWRFRCAPPPDAAQRCARSAIKPTLRLYTPFIAASGQPMRHAATRSAARHSALRYCCQRAAF